MSVSVFLQMWMNVLCKVTTANKIALMPLDPLAVAVVQGLN